MTITPLFRSDQLKIVGPHEQAVYGANAPPKRYRRLAFAPRSGLFALRIGARYWKLKAPWNAPIFSERYGYEPTVVKLLGWRLTFRPLGQ